MEINIVSPSEIELIPENTLEDSIVRDGEWSCETSKPKPLDINKVKLVLKRKAAK